MARKRCLVDGCERGIYAKTLCSTHYVRQHYGRAITGQARQYGKRINEGRIGQPLLPEAVVEDIRAWTEASEVSVYALVQRILVEWAAANSALKAENMDVPYRGTNFAFSLKSSGLPTRYLQQACVPLETKTQLASAAHALQMPMTQLTALIVVKWYEAEFGQGSALSGERRFGANLEATAV